MCSAATGPTPSYSTSCRGRCTRRRPYTEVCRTVVVSVTRAAPLGGGGSNSTPAGYFARVTAMRQLLLRFLAAGVTPDEVPPAKQVRRFSSPPQGRRAHPPHLLALCRSSPSAPASTPPSSSWRQQASRRRCTRRWISRRWVRQRHTDAPSPMPDPPTRRLWLASVPSSGSTRRCTR